MLNASKDFYLLGIVTETTVKPHLGRPVYSGENAVYFPKKKKRGGMKGWNFLSSITYFCAQLDWQHCRPSMAKIRKIKIWHCRTTCSLKGFSRCLCYYCYCLCNCLCLWQCLFAGQVMSPHHSEQMSEGSKVFQSAPW